MLLKLSQTLAAQKNGRAVDKEEAEFRRQRELAVARPDLLKEIQSDIAIACPDYLRFEASVRHFVGRHLSSDMPEGTTIGVVSAGAGAGSTTGPRA